MRLRMTVEPEEDVRSCRAGLTDSWELPTGVLRNELWSSRGAETALSSFYLHHLQYSDLCNTVQCLFWGTLIILNFNSIVWRYFRCAKCNIFEFWILLLVLESIDFQNSTTGGKWRKGKETERTVFFNFNLTFSFILHSIHCSPPTLPPNSILPPTQTSSTPCNG